MPLAGGFSEGYGNDFDISKLRYDKIVIMADAECGRRTYLHAASDSFLSLYAGAYSGGTCLYSHATAL